MVNWVFHVELDITHVNWFCKTSVLYNGSMASVSPKVVPEVALVASQPELGTKIQHTDIDFCLRLHFHKG